MGLLEACADGRTFSSMNTSLIRLLTAVAPTLEVDLDQRTTPEVVNISKASNIFPERFGRVINRKKSAVFIKQSHSRQLRHFAKKIMGPLLGSPHTPASSVALSP